MVRFSYTLDRYQWLSATDKLWPSACHERGGQHYGTRCLSGLCIKSVISHRRATSGSHRAGWIKSIDLIDIDYRSIEKKSIDLIKPKKYINFH